jgi:hypothetical protein
MRLLPAALAALAAGACGHASPAAHRPAATVVRENDLVARLPPGWVAATRSLTPSLLDPREVLAVGTYPLRYRRTGCAHIPDSALDDLGPGDAFVTLMERPRATRGFPPRPARFGPGLGGGSECIPDSVAESHWFTFSDRGRAFHVLVAFGPRASRVTKDQSWGILDGLAVGDATIAIGRPVAGQPYELQSPGLRAAGPYRLLVPRTEPPDLCVATVRAAARLTEADRACTTGDGALFIDRYGPATVVAGLAPNGAARVELDGHALPLSRHRAFLALVRAGRHAVTAVFPNGIRHRLSTRRHRRAGAVFDDEVGERILRSSRARVIERFGPPAATAGPCDYYEVVGDDRRRGWRFCYRAGGVMTGASGNTRLPR